jgi:hypothetical protein
MTVRKGGVIIERYEDENLIVNTARQAVARLLAGEVEGKSITGIAFGVNGAASSPGDTAITSPYIRGISGVSYPEINRIQFDWELLITEGNGKAISEFGLLTGDGTLFARRARQRPINKEQDIALSGQWTIIF